MKYRGIEPHRASPGINLKYQLLHTAISKGIAVFFCSTPFYLFSPYKLIYGSPLQNGAPAVKWVRFLFVKKTEFLQYHSPFWNEREAARFSSYIKKDKLVLCIYMGMPLLLSKWQTFISGYP